jgi:hypothetical protein
MTKEKFVDNTYSLLKALHHTKIAMEYYEDLAKGYEKGAKDLIMHYASKCKWIIDNVRHRMPEDMVAEMDKDLVDALFLDAIADSVIHFNQQQKDDLEMIISMMSKGQLIEILEPNNKDVDA